VTAQPLDGADGGKGQAVRLDDQDAIHLPTVSEHPPRHLRQHEQRGASAPVHLHDRDDAIAVEQAALEHAEARQDDRGGAPAHELEVEHGRRVRRPREVEVRLAAAVAHGGLHEHSGGGEPDREQAQKRRRACVSTHTKKLINSN
jgi:hypothetical protein